MLLISEIQAVKERLCASNQHYRPVIYLWEREREWYRDRDEEVGREIKKGATVLAAYLNTKGRKSRANNTQQEKPVKYMLFHGNEEAMKSIYVFYTFFVARKIFLGARKCWRMQTYNTWRKETMRKLRNRDEKEQCEGFTQKEGRTTYKPLRVQDRNK